MKRHDDKAAPHERFALGVLMRRLDLPADLDWAAATDLLIRQRLAGLAWSMRGRVAVPEEIRETWEGAYRAQEVAGAVLLEEADAALAALAEAGVVGRLIKGAALVRDGAYEGPGARAFDDVDIVVDDDQATIAIEALVSSGFVPWLEDPAATAGWVDAAAFDLRPPHGGLGLSLDLHWRLEYGGLRYGGNGADRRDGGQGVDPSRSDVNWAAGGGSRQLPETDASVGPVGAEEHLALIVEHFLKHMRFRIHLAALADVVRLGERVCKWERVLETLDRGSWGQAGRAFLGGIAAASPSPVWEPLRDPGLAKPSLLRRLDPLQLVREAGEAQPRRALGVFERWQLQGPRAVLRDLRSAASPPDAWLRSRYGAPDGASTAGLRARHLLRVSGWALGLTPSPLSPNQDQSPEA